MWFELFFGPNSLILMWPNTCTKKQASYSGKTNTKMMNIDGESRFQDHICTCGSLILKQNAQDPGVRDFSKLDTFVISAHFHVRQIQR